MTIKIVVDSSCDLPEGLAEENDIAVIPMFVNAGGRGYRDGIELSRQEFYENLAGYQPAPNTGTPGPDVFRQTYDRLGAAGATEILSIHIAQKLSAVIEVARQAALETHSAAVTVFDSQQLSMGAGLLAVTAAKAAAAGKSMPEILAILDNQIGRTHTFAALDTLEYLKRSGRMNGIVSALGSLLQVKPLMLMYRGKPSSEKVFTRSRAVARLVQIFKELVPIEKVVLVHSNAAERAEALLAQVKEYLPGVEVFRAELGPTLGTHVGPGVIGFVCVTRQAKTPAGGIG